MHGKLGLIASFVGYYCHPTTRSLPSSSIIPHSIDFFILVVVDVYKSLATYIINPDVQIDVYSSSKYGSCLCLVFVSFLALFSLYPVNILDIESQSKMCFIYQFHIN